MVRGKENVCMPFKNKIAAALFGLVALPVAAASGAVIGGTYYAPQYGQPVYAPSAWQMDRIPSQSRSVPG